MRFKGFIGPSYKLNSVNVDCQRTVNLYPEMNEMGAGKEMEVASLVSTPGLLLKRTVGAGPIRASYAASNGQYFVVSGNKLYRLSSTMIETEIGTLASNNGSVGIADNGIELVIVDGPNGYFHVLGSGLLTQIVDEDWMGATQVVFQDGYFIFLKPGSQQFYISELSGVEIDALDIASSEAQPDSLVAILSDHRDLWLFGETTTEVFFNSGAADFPFERIQGAYIEHGCAAAFSVAKMNNTVFWLGRDDMGAGVVYQARGYQPERISTHAIELAIQGYLNIADAKAWTYQQSGHWFYVLNFSSANTTWVYDSTTGLWHERTYTNLGVSERHRADNHAYAYGKHLVGDYANGNIYELSSTTYSDNGAAIVRTRISPHLTSELKRVFFNSFQLDIETGIGLDGLGQGIDPKIMLCFSDDGGHSWSNEQWRSAGKIGERKVRAIWRRLGQSRDRVFKVSISDPVKVTFIGADLDLEREAG